LELAVVTSGPLVENSCCQFESCLEQIINYIVITYG
jgi:hypothetical protein